MRGPFGCNHRDDVSRASRDQHWHYHPRPILTPDKIRKWPRRRNRDNGADSWIGNGLAEHCRTAQRLRDERAITVPDRHQRRARTNRGREQPHIFNSCPPDFGGRELTVLGMLFGIDM